MNKNRSQNKNDRADSPKNEEMELEKHQYDLRIDATPHEVAMALVRGGAPRRKPNTKS